MHLNLILEYKKMRRLFQLDQIQMRVLELQHIELELGRMCVLLQNIRELA